MKTVLLTLFSLALLATAGVAALVASGAYNFAADAPHWRLTEAVIGAARHRSIDQRASRIAVPDNLDNPERIRKGAAHYQPMCAGCHLAPGMEDTELRTGLYPTPPVLSEHGIHDPAGAFWTIKHGIKMSGMPAWGTSHDDESLWDIVALLKAMPEMTEAEWQKLSGQETENGRKTGHKHHDHAH